MLFANFWDRNAATKNSTVVAVNFFHSFRSLTPLFQCFQLGGCTNLLRLIFFPPWNFPNWAEFWWQFFFHFGETNPREFIYIKAFASRWFSKIPVRWSQESPPKARHHLKMAQLQRFFFENPLFFSGSMYGICSYIYRILPLKLTRLGEFFGSPGVKNNQQPGNGPQVHALDRVSQTREKCRETPVPKRGKKGG